MPSPPALDHLVTENKQTPSTISISRCNLTDHPAIIKVITGRNEVVAKVIFLHLSVILFTGGVCISACWDTTPPGPGRPPAPPDQADPPGTRQTPPQTRQTSPPGPGRHPPGSRLQHTVYERPVRILLECILV